MVESVKDKAANSNSESVARLSAAAEVTGSFKYKEVKERWKKNEGEYFKYKKLEEKGGTERLKAKIEEKQDKGEKTEKLERRLKKFMDYKKRIGTLDRKSNYNANKKGDKKEAPTLK
ncbi:MAG: hypothetical protein LBG48_04910 [Rickettsiales bacterium]|nr:hypothetical protein [Rickettsiales bacterium]